MPGIKIVGYVCDAEGRHPEYAKVEKIWNWPPYASVRDVKAFLGLCVYYRIWIPYFTIRAGPLYKLLRKGVVFKWIPEIHGPVIDNLKMALISAPALVILDYSEEGGTIILTMDASLRGWKAVLI
jgi:hypothetical protein